MSNYTKTTNFATKDNLSSGNPLKIVKGTEIDTEFNNIATAVGTKTDNSAAAITGGTITGITDLAVADGGTGASTAAGALNNLLPSQTSNANKYLQTDGTNATWDAVSLSTADITGTLPVANGGTGVTTSTGTGNVVLSNSPTLVTPALGTPASGVATNLTGLPLTTGVTGTLPVANGGTGVTTSTGTGSTVLSNSPTLVTPALGTPASGTLTNATGLPISTGVSGLGTGVATFLGTPSSANLASAVSDETGSGALVFANSPTLVTPAIGTPSSGTLTNATGLPISTGVSGLGTGVATFLGTPSSANLLAAVSDETGTGSLVFATSPTLVTPALGTPASGVATNLTGLPLSTGVTGTLPVLNGGTGVTTSTGSGNNVLSTSPTLVTPILGTPTSATLTNATGLPLSTGVTGTLPVANGGTGQTSYTDGQLLIGNSTGNTLTKATLTAGSNVTITNSAGGITIASSGGSTSPGGSTTQVQYNNAGAFGGITGATTNGTALTLVAPVLGTPASATLTNATGLPLSTGVTGTLPIANGGSGQTTATAAFNALAPSQTSNSGKYLTTDGTNSSWATVSGGSSQWTTSGSDIYYTTGKVGIGITTPISNLHVKETTAATPSARLQNANSAGAKYLSFDYDGSGGSYGNFQTQPSSIVLQSGFDTGKIQLTPYNGGTYSSTLGLVMDTNGRVAVSSTLSVGAATPSSSGSGITFPATQSASSDANTLDDYEEGTWTPAITGITSVGYTQQYGNYVKIGKQVTAFVRLLVNAGTGSGAAVTITGLPFTAASSANGGNGGGSVGYKQLTASAVYPAIGEGSTTILLFLTETSAPTDFTLTGTQNGYFMLSVTYFV